MLTNVPSTSALIFWFTHAPRHSLPAVLHLRGRFKQQRSCAYYRLQTSIFHDLGWKSASLSVLGFYKLMQMSLENQRPKFEIGTNEAAAEIGRFHSRGVTVLHPKGVVLGANSPRALHPTRLLIGQR